MNILQLLKKRPSLIVYSGIAILAVLISNKLGITIDNLGQAWGDVPSRFQRRHRTCIMDTDRMYMECRLGL